MTLKRYEKGREIEGKNHVEREREREDWGGCHKDKMVVGTREVVIALIYSGVSSSP